MAPAYRLLTLQLVSQRHLANECLDNQCFLDMRGREVTGQIDVAVLSQDYRFVEGYECKIHADGTYGLASEDCDNLKALVRVASEEGCYVHVGVISFDSDKLVKKRLNHYDAPSYIKAYGLECIADLLSLPEYIKPSHN